MKRSLRRKRRGSRRRSRRSCKSLALVFALVFAPALARPARAVCVEFAQPPAISGTANSAVSVAAGDVDGDGDLDAISASYSDSKIAWYRNDGAGGGWTITTISASASGATSVAVADIDRDGDLDAVSSSFADNRIAWYENQNGIGTSWAAHDIATTASGAQSVAVGDVDGDGDPDAVAALYDSGQIVWYLNDGLGTSWAKSTASNLSYAVTFVATADVDGDGHLDVLSATWQNRIAWHENYDSPGIFGLHVISTQADQAESVDAFDLDGDGDLDVVSASAGDDKIAWYINDGGSWDEQSISNNAPGVVEARVADFDADGDGDVLAASFDDGKVAWYENFGLGTGWVAHTIALGADGAASVFAADLDSDGDLDALSAAASINQIAWYRNDRLHDEALHRPAVSISSIPEGPRAVDVADIDGDGDLDAFTAWPGDHDVTWHENSGDGSIWAIHSVTTLGLTSPFDVVAADIDRDGAVDALVGTTGASRMAVWFENSGDGGNWTFRTISTVPQYTASVAAADLDGDGDPDVVSSSYTQNMYVPARTITWFENSGDGDGTSWALHSVQTGLQSAVASVSAADMDGDGDLDLLSTTYNEVADDRVAWHENDGNANGWTVHTVTSAAANPQTAAAADLDGDGDLDVLSGSYDLGLLAWYENLADAVSWTTHTLWTSSLGLLAVGAADLDGDGDLDALAAFCFGAALRWFENNGSDVGWAQHTLVTGGSACFTSAGAADVDGDGDLDVTFVDSDFRVGWVPNLGSGVFDNGFDSEAGSPPNLACWSTSVP